MIDAKEVIAPMLSEAYPKPPAHPTTVRPYARQGHFTMVDNAIIDFVLPTLTGNEAKALLLVLRKTTGWGKDEDAIPYSQIMAGTGIRSRTTVRRAVEGLETKGHIVVTRAKDSTGRQMPSTLGLNRSLEMAIPAGATPSPHSGGYGPGNGLGAVQEVDSARVQEVNRHEDSNVVGESISSEASTGTGVEREPEVKKGQGKNTSTLGTKPRKVKGITADEARERVEAFLRDDGLGREVGEAIRLAAAQNPKGEMAWTRAWGEFCSEVLHRREQGVTDENWRVGFAAARRAAGRTGGSSVKRINYARSVAVDECEKGGKDATERPRPAPSGTAGPDGSGRGGMTREREVVRKDSEEVAAHPRTTPEGERLREKLVEAADAAHDEQTRGLFVACAAFVDGERLTLVHPDASEAGWLAGEFADVLEERGARVIGARVWRKENGRDR